jgi:hypothetical protein
MGISEDDQKKLLTVIGTEILNEAKELLREHGSIDTHQLIGSTTDPPFDWHPEFNGIVVGFDAPHAEFVEFGSRPHWAPIGPLKEWARRKLGNEKLAYPIQRKIAKKGIKEKPFFWPSVNKVLAKYGNVSAGEL